MLPEQLERFKESGRLISSRDLTDSYLTMRRRLVDAWSTSLSEDDLRREELYRQVKGLDAIIDQIVLGAEANAKFEGDTIAAAATTGTNSGMF